MATGDEMINIAVQTKPDAVSLVPENPNEITTEGGLNVVKNTDNVRAAIDRLREVGIFTSIFIDPTKNKSKPQKNPARSKSSFAQPSMPS
jgi:pyridoxine 5-phosphate synthase